MSSSSNSAPSSAAVTAMSGRSTGHGWRMCSKITCAGWVLRLKSVLGWGHRHGPPQAEAERDRKRRDNLQLQHSEAAVRVETLRAAFERAQADRAAHEAQAEGDEIE
jgi:hypothetical protein